MDLLKELRLESPLKSSVQELIIKRGEAAKLNQKRNHTFKEPKMPNKVLKEVKKLEPTWELFDQIKIDA